MSESLIDATILARLQFAVTSMFHIIWPVLTIGLSLFLVLVEAMWLKTSELLYYRHLRGQGQYPGIYADRHRHVDPGDDHL